ncbi:MAG: TetR/AcrR family transcriptional regulator [Ancrocorticia sp.]|nr:TetR/AcrR family transcriptional regulator [Ancrocorticia sp.]
MPENAPRPGGRPRDTRISESLLAAAARIIERDGYNHATVEGIVREAGTSKPAFYRRYPSVASMIPAIISARHNLDVPSDTGSLEGDLRAFQYQQQELLSDRVVQRCMAGWLADLSESAERMHPFAIEFAAKRQQVVSTILERAVQRGEISELPTASDHLFEALVTPLLYRSLFPQTGKVGPDEIELTVHLACKVVLCKDSPPAPKK